MEPEFWHNRWEQNRIGFHQDRVNSYLQEYLSELVLRRGERVFVPLCGKSLDMVWLHDQGFTVLGVEISPLAVAQFFKETGREACQTRLDGFTRWHSDRLEILCGDFFSLTREDMGKVAAVYDRASLIALPLVMRRDYVRCLATLLTPATPMLLITLEYQSGGMQGPPFSVSEEEVNGLFSTEFTVQRLAARNSLPENPHFREHGLTHLEEKAYLLHRR